MIVAMSDTKSTTAGASVVRPAAILRRRISEGEVDFRGLAADLLDLGQAASVRAALSAAEVVRVYWAARTGWPADEREQRALQATLDATRTWLAAPSDEARREVRRAASQVKPVLDTLERRARPCPPDPGDPLFDEDCYDEDWDFDTPDDMDAGLAHLAGVAARDAARAACARTDKSAAAHASAALAGVYRAVSLDEFPEDLAPALPPAPVLAAPVCTRCGGHRSHVHQRVPILPIRFRVLLAALAAAVTPPAS